MFYCDIEIAGITVRVFTHACPHADELTALFLLENVGTKEFVDKYCSDRKLYLGVNGGPFDEHVKGREEKSCLLLVAEALGLDLREEPWGRIIRFVNMNDVDGRKSNRDIAALLKQMMMQNPEGQDEHAQWFLNGLLVKYYDGMNRDFSIDRISDFAVNGIRELNFNIHKWKEKGENAFQLQKKFFENAVEDMEAKFRAKSLRNFTIKKGEDFLKVFMVKSGNYTVSAALRSKFGADLVIIKNDRDHLMIAVRQRDVKGLEEVAAILRLREQFKNGSIKERNWNILREDFTLSVAPEWCYLSKMKMIFNGGITHPDTPKTKLSDEEIIEAIKIGLGDHFLDDCQSGCQRCAWNKYGLKRCRSRRYEQNTKK